MLALYVNRNFVTYIMHSDQVSLVLILKWTVVYGGRELP